MPQQKIITIPKPCSENWENMSPTQQGRHCFSCEKEVVDFTRFSKQELLQYFSKPKNSDHKICGRFNESQIQKAPLEVIKPIRTNVYWQQFLYLLVTLIYPAFVSCQTKQHVKGKVAISAIKPTQSSPQLNTVKDTPEVNEILGEVLEVQPIQRVVKPPTKQPHPEIMGKVMLQPNPPIQNPKIPIPKKRDTDGRPKDGRPSPIKTTRSNEPRFCIPQEPVLMGDTIIQDSK